MPYISLSDEKYKLGLLEDVMAGSADAGVL